MAKFGPYYGLCPLIDIKSLLGISEDTEKGNVVVTLGRNIAIKYKLSDQKQIYSWRTKEKFSSPIIYDKNQSKYVAVFNQSYIRLWSGDEDEHLDKLKKYKFNKQIHTLISANNTTFIVFQNGAIYTLEEALELRKTLNPEDVISETDRILEVLFTSFNDQFYLGLIVEAKGEFYLHWTSTSGLKSKFSSIKVDRADCTLMGYMFHKDTSVRFLTVWSDGRIFSCPLQNPQPNETIGDLFAAVESVSTKDPVTMASLNENYIAIYGANTNEEGAVLIIYNTQFKVNQTKQPFKLFTIGAKLWCINNNLFVPVGQNLAVVPFFLDTEQLAALVGSHKVLENDPDIAIVDEMEVAEWDSGEKMKNNRIPAGIKMRTLDLVKRGLPENQILEALLPDIFEKNQVGQLRDCLNYFNDISEKSLAKILKFLLKLDNKSFFDRKLDKSNNLPASLQPGERVRLLDLILSKSFSEVLLLPHLRKELPMNDILLLLKYICFMFSEEGHCLLNCNFVETQAILIKWGCVVIDSNYQKFLLTKDEEVSAVLMEFNGLVKNELECLEDVKQVAPVLAQVVLGKDIPHHSNMNNLRYTVEQICL